MRWHDRVVAAFAAIVLTFVAVAAEAADANQVAMTGDLPQAFVIDASTLKAIPRAGVDANDHGTPGHWDGVRLRDLLIKAGAPLDKALRGPALRGIVTVSARDGYAVAFTLGELDAAMGNAEVILADTRDGKAMNENEGPYRLIVRGDQRAARWVRQVSEIRLTLPPAEPGTADEKSAHARGHH